ncbi:MAG: hypothetical protein CMI01_02665 [Oceanospirillaceae bacterium]|nr:hypothetical protein [Oceanospirillaceae bacterium]
MKSIWGALLLLVVTSVQAEKPQWVEQKQKQKAEDRVPEQTAGTTERGNNHQSLPDALTHSERERLRLEVLRHYGVEAPHVGSGVKSLPPGLQKKLARGGSLPPGWQDKLLRGRDMDYELYRQAEHLPSDLLNKITGRNDGIELLRLGDRIVRVMEGRGTVLDVVVLTDKVIDLME